MTILLNPYSGGGTARTKWLAAKEHLDPDVESANVISLDRSMNADADVAGALQRGERRFVAAGGDGTVNLLLNAIVNHATSAQLKELRLGAIGLGSSNDFHKPFKKQQVAGGISYKIDFSAALPRDVGCLRSFAYGAWSTNYFVVNASVGTTAEANSFFNQPDTLLQVLKRRHTASAILYAALHTIIRHADIQAVCMAAGKKFSASVTNLGVFKNPHFSGSLSYGGTACYDDGAFRIRLYEHLRTAGLLRLMASLSEGRELACRSCKRWDCSLFVVKSPTPFAVEFDGEVVTTQEAEFSVLPTYIRVCP
jgi:diacylglycerol kinase family enzyme